MRINMAIMVALTLLLLSGASAYSCDADTLFWATLNETSGNYMNACNGTIATNNGATMGVTGIFDKAGDFELDDGDYVDTNMQADVTGNGTITAWFKPESLGTQQSIAVQCDSGGGAASISLVMEIYTDDKLRCWARDASGNTGGEFTSSSSALSTGNWYFMECSYNSSSGEVCATLNGTANCAASSSAPASSGSYNWSIGRFGEYNGFFADGIIDEVTVWNRLLTGHFGDAGTEVGNIAEYNDITGGGSGGTPAYGTISNTYTTPIYETNDTLFNFSIWYNSTNITSATAGLNWNDTQFPYTSTGNSTSGDNVTIWWAYDNFTLPLVQTNNTNIATWWEYNITWTNATTHVLNSTNNTQAIYHACYWDDYYPDTAVLYGDNIHFYSDITDLMSRASYNLWALFNNTNYTLSGTTNPYTATTAAPNPQGNNESWTSNSTLNVTYASPDYGGTRTYQRISENETISVYEASLVSCGAISTTTTINYTFYEETNIATRYYSDMDATLWVYPVMANGTTNTSVNTTASFNFTDTYNATICIYPSWATVEVDSWQSYWGNTTDYNEPRAYFLVNAELDNTTEHISLYVINKTLTTLIALEVDDDTGSPVDNSYIYFMRYYPNENVYRTIAMVLTDDFGEGSTYLVPNDIWYRISIVTSDGTALTTFTPQTVPCDPTLTLCDLYLSLSPDLYMEYTQYNDEFSWACAFNETGTNATVCSYTDTSGLMQYARLYAWKAGLFNSLSVCDTNLTTASGALTCNYGDMSGVYTYTFAAHFADEIALESDTIEYGVTGALFDASGLIMGGMLVLAVAAMGLYSAGIAIIMAAVGLIFGRLLGLFSLEFSAVVAITVVAVVLFVKMQR